MACLVFLRMAFSFINLISSSTKREAAIMKICPPAIITSAEVIIAEYDAILGQWKRENFYNHLGNYTKILYSFSTTSSHWCKIKRKKKILPQLLLISQSDWLICRGKKESLPRCSRQCVTQCLFQLALWYWYWYCDIVVKNTSKCGFSWYVLLSITSTRHNSFPEHFFESDAYKQLICIM